jgi:hypothetical protein
MACKKQPVRNGFVLFDVIYEDATRSSSREVATAELDMLDSDASVRRHRGARPEDRRDVRAVAASRSRRSGARLRAEPAWGAASASGD